MALTQGLLWCMEREEERKPRAGLGLHWGSFKAGIPSRATSNHWPNMSNSHFKEG